MHSANYFDTLIEISEDSPTRVARVPEKPGTVAAMQYERVAAAPYALTSDDLIFGVHAERTEIPEEERHTARSQFFSRGQACLRASPLVKTHGWGVHHDHQGRVALVAAGSNAYAALQADPAVTKVMGMRAKRAG